jgi:serine/threonine protein kinase
MSSVHQTNPVPFQGLDCTGVIDQGALLELLKKRPLADVLQTSRVLKEDKKRRVAIIRIDETLNVFVKVHFDNSFSDRLRALVFKSRSQCSHDKALSLLQHGLPTPGSLGYADFRSIISHDTTGHSHSGSAHFTTFLDRGETLTDQLKKAPEQHQRLVELGFQLLTSLHSHGFIHGDLKLNNLMMQNQKLYYIDIDSAAQTTKLRARSKDLARFLVALSEANVALEHTQKAFSEYCQTLGLAEQKISAAIRPIAHRIQRKHLLKYQRPARQFL